jgi:polyphosphate kinase
MGNPGVGQQVGAYLDRNLSVKGKMVLYRASKNAVEFTLTVRAHCTLVQQLQGRSRQSIGFVSQ